jgi:hypothetical protein
MLSLSHIDPENFAFINSTVTPILLAQEAREKLEAVELEFLAFSRCKTDERRR